MATNPAPHEASELSTLRRENARFQTLIREKDKKIRYLKNRVLNLQNDLQKERD